MEKLESIEKKIYDDLSNPNPERAVFLEGAVYLEQLINSILMYYFCRTNPEVREEFKRFLLNSLLYSRKIDLLKKTKIIDKDLFKDLKKIGEERNLAAHSVVIPYDLISGNRGWIGEKKIVKIDPASIDEYKKKVAKCYAHLASKFSTLISEIEKSR